MEATIKKIFDKQLINETDTAVIVYDLNSIDHKVNSIQSAFPKNTLHAIAIKANPLIKVLERLVSQGCGLEAASLAEIKLAEKAGAPFHKIVFDSPAKTVLELKYALEKGIHINADSFQELERIDKLLQSISSTSNIGLRINPQIGMGDIESTSVSGQISKFGVPLGSNREKIFETYEKYTWLTGIHVHIGSQGYPVQQLIRGIKRIYLLTNEINQKLLKYNRNLSFFDLGGGLPVTYHPDDQEITAQKYVNLLRSEIPDLFNGRFELITEFGRYIHANAAIALSRVEYVKNEKDHSIIINHLGADFMLRKCYNPDDWHHEISLVDHKGNLKKGGEKHTYSIAGPLCFSGDFIAKNIMLPKVEEGDYLIIHDVGAYTLSMWSMYNSRQLPLVVGVEGDRYTVLKERGEFDEILNFWS